MDVHPANEKESLLVLRHLERQIQNRVTMQNIALERGYDAGAVHRGLELLGVTGYIPAIQLFEFSGKIRLLLSAPRRCVLLSRGRKTCLSTVELQPNNRKIFALLSSRRRYLQTL